MNNLIGKSEIYCITNIQTGKKYIGQAQCYYKNKDGNYYKAGYKKRFESHIYKAKNNTNGCRYLSHSILKYGEQNHTIEVIFTCPTEEANYWEIEYIKKYNTVIPNGMNIMEGGKCAVHSDETKKLLSESKKGKYTGENNPMYGKKHTEETIEKIKDALTGVALTSECKANMSKSHQENLQAGKLPPRRKFDLPKYIYHVKSKNKEGYEIRHHPKLKQKQFTAKTISLEENLQRAINYLKDENNPNNQKQEIQSKTYENLPRYIRQVRSEKYEGFEIKFHPTLANKKWTSMKMSMDEKLKIAKEYLDKGSETKSLSAT